MRLAKSRFLVLTLVISVVMLIAAGCAGGGDGDLSLDVETLQADFKSLAFEAEPMANAHVGEVNEDLFVAVTVDEPAEPEQVSVYLCDGEEFSQWLSGELNAEGVAELGEDMGAQVALTVDEGGNVSGVVQPPGDVPQPFTATAATGDAGLYRAEEAVDGVTHVGGWIVLPDGRQKGQYCCTCRSGICHPGCCVVTP